MAYVPNINEYLGSLEKRFGPHWDKWPQEEVSYMERLQFHKRAKAKVGTFLEKPIAGLLNVQFNLLGLGLKLGWHDSSERKVIQKRLLGDLFSTNLTLEAKRSCLLHRKYSNGFGVGRPSSRKVESIYHYSFRVCSTV